MKFEEKNGTFRLLNETFENGEPDLPNESNEDRFIDMLEEVSDEELQTITDLIQEATAARIGLERFGEIVSQMIQWADDEDNEGIKTNYDQEDPVSGELPEDSDEVKAATGMGR